MRSTSLCTAVLAGSAALALAPGAASALPRIQLGRAPPAARRLPQHSLRRTAPDHKW